MVYSIVGINSQIRINFKGFKKMDTYITSYCTDAGIKKRVNQDSLCIKKALLKDKTILMALVCDGMGGLSKGELVSATVIRGFSDWFAKDLEATQGDIDKIRNQWESLVINLNTKLWNYGKKNAAELGTTLTAILLVEGKEYLIAQVGDSRAYEIGQTINQITEDQSFVAREVKRGNMTKEQALVDPRRNVLLQCIGASKSVKPVFYEGQIGVRKGFLLCSDGFRHTVLEQEMFQALSGLEDAPKEQIKEKLRQLVEENKKRGETDNITAVYIGKTAR